MVSLLHCTIYGEYLRYSLYQDHHDVLNFFFFFLMKSNRINTFREVSSIVNYDFVFYYKTGD